MKNKFIVILILSFALCSALVILSFAHPGKTDEYGGHYDYEAGEYHYHHGYPAHQHPDGICPYNFDDQTDHSSGASSYSNNEYKEYEEYDEEYNNDNDYGEQTTNTPTTVPDNSHKGKTNDSSSFIDIIENIVNWIFLILLLLGFAFYIGIIIYGIFFDKKK